MLAEILTNESVDAVVHFAGLKAVSESVADPLRYYRVNVVGTVSLLQAMQAAGIRQLVFSSSCTVYGAPKKLPVDETAPRGATNPYGRTKLIVEDMLADLAATEEQWQITLLRYFNPVGAHPSGRLGEDPAGIPNNLMPYVMQVGTGRHPYVRVFGDDYPTRDGTGIRDYIQTTSTPATEPPWKHHNSGAGQSTSAPAAATPSWRSSPPLVARSVATCPTTSSTDVPATSLPRGPTPSLAELTLGWRARYDLDAMAADHWRWQSRNPEGATNRARLRSEGRACSAPRRRDLAQVDAGRPTVLFTGGERLALIGRCTSAGASPATPVPGPARPPLARHLRPLTSWRHTPGGGCVGRMLEVEDQRVDRPSGSSCGGGSMDIGHCRGLVGGEEASSR